ncbi:hypothetical protein QBC43DRAFT_356433 [Cladorrhinum sp. PSN259]|nr:hypothetical protein QBC43DRAFT_356433 [Cladorrhinum sp. PSN259]
MALQLVYRAARPSLTTTTATPSAISFITHSTRPLSLSSTLQKTAPGGWTRSDSKSGEKGLNYAERKRAREELTAQRPTYKIHKGRKDITEYPDKARPQSRQSRFYDPQSTHGKKSLVYKLKTGQLAEELKEIQAKTGQLPDSLSAFMTSKGEQVRDNKFTRKERAREGGRDKGIANADDIAAMIRGEEPKSRGFGGSRDKDFKGSRDRDFKSPRDRAFGNKDRGFGGGRDRDSRPPRDNAFGGARDRDARPSRDGDANPRRTFGDKPDFTSRNRDDRPPRSSSFSSPGSDFKERSFDRPPRSSSSPPPRSDFKERSFDRPSTSSELRPRRNDPISIPYTTAASQFLYGKSVVEAALNSSRRKLYKLYIYHGDNRQNVEDNNQLRNLATRKGVEVVILRSEDDLRLLDKMAASRPHNGFVLEASPLPEPPLKSLGPVPEVQEEYAANPGFPFELGHQSAEEAAINGAETFIPSKSVTHRPLVLVLDRILDPGNLGAILRTANFLGVTAVGITKFGGAKLTPVALKASSGASESMNLFSISSLPEFLNSSRANGWVTYAAVAKEPSVHRLRRHLDLYDVEKTDPLKTTPCILIIGSEGEGLDRLVVKKADYELSVPNMSGSGAVDSLNVGIAAGLLCTSFLKGMTRELNGVFESKMVEEGQEVRAEGDLW